ncbi:olfactory receptor 6N2-like [Xenentodon cancila]
MFIVYILVIVCNSTILFTIWIEKSLHEPMYIFIAALLLNSLFFSTNIYPKLLIDVLSDKQVITYSACLFQCFLYYFLNGTEFLLLSAMAYDRYVSISKPLQYPIIMKRTAVAFFLGFAWLVPACQIAVPVALSAKTKLCHFILKGIFCNNSIYKLHCTTSAALSVYGVIVLLNLTVLPMLFILFTYAKILKVTYKSCGEVKKKAARTCLPHLLVLINYTCLVTWDVIVVKLESDFSKSLRLTLTLQIIVSHPFFNPIIYGLKMKEISKHIKRLFCRGKIN